MLIKYNSTSTVDASPRGVGGVSGGGAIVPMNGLSSYGTFNGNNMVTSGLSGSGGGGGGGSALDDYEYHPDALGVVTKRTWNASTDLAYEEDIKVKNNRTKRPVSQLTGGSGASALNKQASVTNMDGTGSGGGMTRQSSQIIKQPSMRSRQGSMRK